MTGAPYRRFLARLETTRTLGVSLGLDRVRAALVQLGSPERRLRIVQIAGTNGKGSTAAMTEALLRAAGFRTGLFTSPHLSRFTERIRLDGREVDGDHLAAFDERVAATGVPLTYFEVSAVLAYLVMAEAGVEAAVMETGLGGRLDAVTAAEPLACAITSIGLDHTEFLGPTLTDVAREKAGIAKPGVPLYLGPLPDEAAREIARVASAIGAPLRRLDIDFRGPDRPPALPGPHQIINAALAIALAQAVVSDAGRALSADAVDAGLRQVIWPGRLERVAPDVLLDCAHNLDGARALLASLPIVHPRALVTSIVRGKDASAMLSLWGPAFDLILATRSQNPRSLPPEDLVVAMGAGPRIRPVAQPWQALCEARSFVAAGGLVVVAGSIFLVGELRARLLGEAVDPIAGGDPLP